MFRARTINEKTVQAAINGSGDIVSFESAFEKPLSSLLVNIDPVQSGEGEPSPTNIRPISGWTGADLARTGKNLLPKLPSYTSYGMTLAVDENGIATLSGQATQVGGTVGQRDFKLQKGTYIVTGGGSTSYSLRIYNVDNSTTLARLRSESASATFTLTAAANVRAFIRADVAGEVSNLTFYPMIRLASDADSTYEPYKGTTYPITWSDTAGTVYGGTLDVVRGKLRVTHRGVDMGTLTWTYSSAPEQFRAALIPIPSGTIQDTPAPGICSIYKGVTYRELTTSDKTFAIFYATTRGVNVKDSQYTDAASFKSAVSGQMLVYELATPIEYDLDPITINTLLGQNNVWADCGDIDELAVDPITGKLKFKLIQ